MERAQKDYELALIESGLMKDEIMASAKGLTQAEIDVKIARMDLEKTRIRAPFAGIVTDIRISAGESLAPGRDLLTLVDVSLLRVKARVLESEAGKIRPGRDALLRFSAHPGKAFRGRVEVVSPVILAAERTLSVFIRIMDPSREIKPGMHAEAEIVTDIYNQRLLVPQEAILVRGGRKLVFIVEDGVAKWRYVEVGAENARFAEVRSSGEPDGVKEGAAVIVEGHFALAHDTRVGTRE
jgi:RND family efflux transporter MFP subunit